MKLDARVVSVETGVVESTPFAILWVLEADEQAPTRLGVKAPCIPAVRALKFGDAVRADVAMVTYLGKSKLVVIAVNS